MCVTVMVSPNFKGIPALSVDRPFREENVPMPSANWQEHLPELNSLTSVSFVFVLILNYNVDFNR